MIAVIGGTGLNQFSAGKACGESETPYGQASAAPVKSLVEDKECIFLARHGSPHKVAPHLINYRANLWALKKLGVRKVLAVNAVGGIAATMVAGAIVIPDQLVDFTYGREHSYYDGLDYGADTPGGLEHIDFSFPFSEGLRQKVLAAAGQSSLSVIERGVYAVTQGPRLESAAEINRLEQAGCDIVGMTAMPEAALARELGMEYASISLVVNPAAGRGEGVITMDDIHSVIESGMVQVRQLLTATIRLL